MPTATSLPITCAAAIVSASAWVGFTLPGMIELPGSFSGIAISPIPQRGPEASRRTSLAILKSETATVCSAPWAKTSASRDASASNLFGALTKGWPVSSASFAARAAAELGVGVEAGADRRPAERELEQAGERLLEARDAVVELRRPAGDLLAERERRRVHEVGAADLHDVAGRPRPSPRACRAGARPPGSTSRRRASTVGHVDRGGEGVVRGLAAVHVVVRVDEAPLAALAAEDLAGAVRQDLVDVHVRLGAAAGLPHHERELVVPAAGQHLVRRGHDGARPSRRRGAPSSTWTRATAFFTRTRAWTRASGTRSPEIRKCSSERCGLRAPQALGRHLDRAEACPSRCACDRCRLRPCGASSVMVA